MICNIGPIISDSCGKGGGFSVEGPLAGTTFCRGRLYVGVDTGLSWGSAEAFAGGPGADIVVVG